MRVNYYCDIQFDNGQFEKSTPLKNPRSKQYNILPADDARAVSEPVVTAPTVSEPVVAAPVVAETADDAPVMTTEYVPKKGDIVVAHSCGSDENQSGVYTDAWFRGKIAKVTPMVHVRFFFACTL